MTPGGRPRRHRRVVRPGPVPDEVAVVDALHQHPDAVPERAREDTDESWEVPAEDSADARLRREVPPHW